MHPVTRAAVTSGTVLAITAAGLGVASAADSGSHGRAVRSSAPVAASLPRGKTETGVYAITTQPDTATNLSPLSFSVPLKTHLSGTHAPHASATKNSAPRHCPGSYTTPAAQPGYLCIYPAAAENVHTITVSQLRGQPGASRAGAVLQIAPKNNDSGALATGSWAVTGA